MAHVSDLVIEHPEVQSFADFEKLVVQKALEGEIHLFFDIKPEYPDTPRGWEKRLELAFYQADWKKKKK